MALVKTTLSLISKLKKEILHVFFPTLRRDTLCCRTYENDFYISKQPKLKS
jgi:hypothetical protein